MRASQRAMQDVVLVDVPSDEQLDDPPSAQTGGAQLVGFTAAETVQVTEVTEAAVAAVAAVASRHQPTTASARKSDDDSPRRPGAASAQSSAAAPAHSPAARSGRPSSTDVDGDATDAQSDLSAEPGADPGESSEAGRRFTLKRFTLNRFTLNRFTLNRFTLDRWWPVAAVLILVLVVAANSLLTARDERARFAALADVPDFLAPLDRPVHQLWENHLTSGSSLTATAGHLVGVDRGPEGQVDIVAVDPRTGDTVWRVPARARGPIDGWTTCAAPAATAPVGGSAASPGAAPVVVCVVADKVVITAENTGGYVYYPTQARLLILDAATGAVLTNSPTEPSTTVAALDGDLVTSRIDADGRVHVARTGPRGAVDRWTFTSPDPVPVDDTRQRVAVVTVVDGLVVVEAGLTWVLSASGQIKSVWTTGPRTELGSRLEVLHDGQVLAEPVNLGDGTPATRFVDLTTGASFTAASHPIHLAFDDGSLADLVLAKSVGENNQADLVAYDAVTGRPRWTIHDTAGGGTAIIDGRVLRIETGELQSLDGRTGEVVWATPVTRAAQSPLVTDGREVLLTRQEPGQGLVLASYGLDDGRLHSTISVPEDMYPFTLDRKLYGWTQQSLVGFG